MSTPVVTNKWAGNFDCSVCRRKRLMAEEFSRRAMENHRRTGAPLKCKSCSSKEQKEEQEIAKSRRATNQGEKRVCVSCQKELDGSFFNRNQWGKGEGKSRCRECVDLAVEEEANKKKEDRQTAIENARSDVEKAKASGNSQAILKAESVLSALEAEKVTGLKPVRLGRGGRAGRWQRGGRSGRGGRR